MSEFFRKTDAGRRELRERRLGLPRPGRNLLLIIDGTRPAQHWVAMIQGASVTDVSALLELGLIEPGTGSPAGDSQFAGMQPSAPAQLADPPNTTPAGWTQLGGLTRPDGLPSPGAAPRHQSLYAAHGDTRPAALPPAEAGGRPAALSRPLAGPVPSDFGESGPGSLPPDPSGFVPLDAPLGAATGLGYHELYDSLNALVRETLGLLKGYRYSLKIERAHNLADLEAVAQEFVSEVRRLRGDARARMVERALGLGG